MVAFFVQLKLGIFQIGERLHASDKKVDACSLSPVGTVSSLNLGSTKKSDQ